MKIVFKGALQAASELERGEMFKEIKKKMKSLWLTPDAVWQKL